MHYYAWVFDAGRIKKNSKSLEIYLEYAFELMELDLELNWVAYNYKYLCIRNFKIWVIWVNFFSLG